MADIKLNFINQSNDANNSDIVIFQKSNATDFNEFAVAWQVIKNCGHGWSHPINYSMEVAVGCSDSWGNNSPQLMAENGQRFSITRTASGDTLELSGDASSHNEVEIQNNLPVGAIDANVYRDGHLCATKTGIAPGQKAVFEFKPTIWIGVASEIEQGQVMNSAILETINTEISLLGIESADIVMTGGGPGASSTPFVFTLENVMYA